MMTLLEWYLCKAEEELTAALNSRHPNNQQLFMKWAMIYLRDAREEIRKTQQKEAKT